MAGFCGVSLFLVLVAAAGQQVFAQLPNCTRTSSTDSSGESTTRVTCSGPLFNFTSVDYDIVLDKIYAGGTNVLYRINAVTMQIEQEVYVGNDYHRDQCLSDCHLCVTGDQRFVTTSCRSVVSSDGCPASLRPICENTMVKVQVFRHASGSSHLVTCGTAPLNNQSSSNCQIRSLTNISIISDNFRVPTAPLPWKPLHISMGTDTVRGIDFSGHLAAPYY
eukprot:scpid102621/ scgid26914/ 